MSETDACAPSMRKNSFSPKSGARKGFVAAGGDAAIAQRGVPSGAENSEVRSMRGRPFVIGP